MPTHTASRSFLVGESSGFETLKERVALVSRNIFQGALMFSKGGQGYLHVPKASSPLTLTTLQEDKSEELACHGKVLGILGQSSWKKAYDNKYPVKGKLS